MDDPSLITVDRNGHAREKNGERQELESTRAFVSCLTRPEIRKEAELVFKPEDEINKVSIEEKQALTETACRIVQDTKSGGTVLSYLFELSRHAPWVEPQLSFGSVEISGGIYGKINKVLEILDEVDFTGPCLLIMQMKQPCGKIPCARTEVCA